MIIGHFTLNIIDYIVTFDIERVIWQSLQIVIGKSMRNCDSN